jgi:hypothetical protein
MCKNSCKSKQQTDFLATRFNIKRTNRYLHPRRRKPCLNAESRTAIRNILFMSPCYCRGRTVFVADAHPAREGGSLRVRMKSCLRLRNLNQRSAAQSRRQPGKRARAVRNESFRTMKTFFSIILGFAVSIGTVSAGPVKKAGYVAKSTAVTAKNVAHGVVKGARRTVHTVVDTLTR